MDPEVEEEEVGMRLIVLLHLDSRMVVVEVVGDIN